jgi:hypothetical protein
MTATVISFPTPAPDADRDTNDFQKAFLQTLADDPRLDAIVRWSMQGGAK